MSNDWIILEKVGKWAGLEEDALDAYIEAASDVHQTAVAQHQSEYDFDEEYYRFLNQEVISTPVLVERLVDAGVSQEKLNRISQGEIDFEEIVPPRHWVEYGLDEIVDFIMLLKLLREYQRQTGEPSIQPLEKLHYLVFLINHRLAQEDDLVRLEDTLGLGNLQRTGYRYSFRKQDSVPHAKSLTRDKDRLVSWGLLDEHVLDDHHEHRFPFGISVGDTGDFFFTRYGEKMEQFDSLLLKTWETKQTEVLREFAASSPQTIQSYLDSVDRINAAFEGHVILHGRPMSFTEDDEQSVEEARVHG